MRLKRHGKVYLLFGRYTQKNCHVYKGFKSKRKPDLFSPLSTIGDNLYRDLLFLEFLKNSFAQPFCKTNPYQFTSSEHKGN